MKVSFVEAIRLGFVRFKEFRGTSSRTEYWYFVLFSLLLGIVLSTIEALIWPQPEPENIIEAGSQNTPLSNIAAIVLLLPTLALTSRRIRDAGWSGKWLLLYLLPLAALAMATFGLISYLQQTPNPTVEELAVTISYLVPTLLLAIGIQIFLLVLCLRPTKTKEQGNKYATN